MAQETHTVLESPASELPPWPGQRLREAREGLNLSRQEVARKLRLDVNLIQALEDNKREALPAPTYLVGYLRSYARLLNLPVDSIIADTRLNLQPTKTLLPDNIDYRHPQRFETLLRLVLLGLLVVLVLAMGYWFLSMEPEWLSRWLNQGA
jgi:cytoskeleton protein RodZ